MALIGFPDLQ